MSSRSSKDGKDELFNLKMFSPLTTPVYARAKKLDRQQNSDVDSEVSMVTKDIRKEVESLKKKVFDQSMESSEEDLFKTQLFPSSQESPKPNKQVTSDSSSDSESSSSSFDNEDLKKKILLKRHGEAQASSTKKHGQNSDQVDVMSPNTSTRVSIGPRMNKTVTSTPGNKRKSSDSGEEMDSKSPRKKLKFSGSQDKMRTNSGIVSSMKTPTNRKNTSHNSTDSEDKEQTRFMNKSFDSDTQGLKEKSTPKVIQSLKHIKEKVPQNSDLNSSVSEKSELDSKVDKTSKGRKRKSFSSASDSNTKDSGETLKSFNRDGKGLFRQESKISLKGKSNTDLKSYINHNISSSSESDSSEDEQEKGKKPAETNIVESKDKKHSGNTGSDKIKLAGESSISRSDSEDEINLIEKVGHAEKAAVDIREELKEKEKRNSGSESDSSAMSSILPYNNVTVVDMNTSQNDAAANTDVIVNGGPDTDEGKERSDRDRETDMIDSASKYCAPKNFTAQMFEKIHFSDENLFREKKLFLIKASSRVKISAYANCGERIKVPGKTSIGVKDKLKRVTFKIDQNPPKQVQQIRLMSRTKSGSCSFLKFGKAIEGQIDITPEVSALENVIFNKQQHQKHELTESRKKMLTPFGSESPIRETVLEGQDMDDDKQTIKLIHEGTYNTSETDFVSADKHKKKKKRSKIKVEPGEEFQQLNGIVKKYERRESCDIADDGHTVGKEKKAKKKKVKKELKSDIKEESGKDQRPNVYPDEKFTKIKGAVTKLEKTETYDTPEIAENEKKHKKKKVKEELHCKIKEELEIDQKPNIHISEEHKEKKGKVLGRTNNCDIPDEGKTAERKKKRKKKKFEKD